MGLEMELRCNSRLVCQEVNDMYDEWEGKVLAKHGVVIHWDRASAIHRWFMEHTIGDGMVRYVSLNDLVRLHDAVVEVLSSTTLIKEKMEVGESLVNGEYMQPVYENGYVLKNPKKAREVLPTKDGDFGYNPDYDREYWHDLEFTLMKLEKILAIDFVSDEKEPWFIHHADEPDWVVEFIYEYN